ncbi:MAG: redox-regulated ATPase YchF [Patescibacteria group bacterium]|nr:redox-regulated ATPase YchF [Patescibacteria group bacterium]
MSLSIGIVGLPNVGKSTLFNALLKKQIALSANYPFATIEPNVGVTEVPDERLEKLAKVVDTEVIKPALVEFYDIAGLIKGAAQGEGLGNKFLSHIRETSAICHVLRAFTDENVIREGSVDPKQDLIAIRTELQLADLEILEKQKKPKGESDKKELQRWGFIQEFKQNLESGRNVFIFSLKDTKLNENLSEIDKEKLQLAKELNLLTAKPELFVINTDEEKLTEAKKIRTDFAQQLSQPEQKIQPNQIVIISAKIESELVVLCEEDQELYMQDLGIDQSGLERLARVAYETLGLQSFLTAGQKEVRAWTIRVGSTAAEAAGVIHTDFSKNFIKAKVANYDDFIKFGGWKGLKDHGKLRLEGRDYLMKPDDVVEFMIGK